MSNQPIGRAIRAMTPLLQPYLIFTAFILAGAGLVRLARPLAEPMPIYPVGEPIRQGYSESAELLAGILFVGGGMALSIGLAAILAAVISRLRRRGLDISVSTSIVARTFAFATLPAWFLLLHRLDLDAGVIDSKAIVLVASFALAAALTRTVALVRLRSVLDWGSDLWPLSGGFAMGLFLIATVFSPDRPRDGFLIVAASTLGAHLLTTLVANVIARGPDALNRVRRITRAPAGLLWLVVPYMFAVRLGGFGYASKATQTAVIGAAVVLAIGTVALLLALGKLSPSSDKPARSVLAPVLIPIWIALLMCGHMHGPTSQVDAFHDGQTLGEGDQMYSHGRTLYRDVSSLTPIQPLAAWFGMRFMGENGRSYSEMWHLSRALDLALLGLVLVYAARPGTACWVVATGVFFTNAFFFGMRHVGSDMVILLALLHALRGSWWTLMAATAVGTLTVGTGMDQLGIVVCALGGAILVNLLTRPFRIGRALFHGGVAAATCLVVGQALFTAIGEGAWPAYVNLLRDCLRDQKWLFGLPLPGAEALLQSFTEAPDARLGLATAVAGPVLLGLLLLIAMRRLARSKSGSDNSTTRFWIAITVLSAASLCALPSGLMRSDAGHLIFGSGRTVLVLVLIGVAALHRMLARRRDHQTASVGAVVLVLLGFVDLGDANRGILRTLGVSCATQRLALTPPRLGRIETDADLNSRAAYVDSEVYDRSLRQVVDYIQRRAPDGQSIYDFNGGLLYYLASRPNPSRFSLSYLMANPRDELDTIARLEAAGRSLVVFKSGAWYDDIDGLPAEYRFGFLGEYLLKRYVPIDRVGSCLMAGPVERATPDWSLVQELKPDVFLGKIPFAWGEKWGQINSAAAGPVLALRMIDASGRPTIRNSKDVNIQSGDTGSLTVTTTGAHPWIEFNAPPISADVGNYVVVTLTSDAKVQGRLSFQTAHLQVPSEDGAPPMSSIGFEIPRRDGPRRYVFRVGSYAPWRWGGTIQGLRFMPQPGGNAKTITLHAIELYHLDSPPDGR